MEELLPLMMMHLQIGCALFDCTARTHHNRFSQLRPNDLFGRLKNTWIGGFRIHDSTRIPSCGFAKLTDKVWHGAILRKEPAVVLSSF